MNPSVVTGSKDATLHTNVGTRMHNAGKKSVSMHSDNGQRHKAHTIACAFGSFGAGQLIIIKGS